MSSFRNLFGNYQSIIKKDISPGKNLWCKNLKSRIISLKSGKRMSFIFSPYKQPAKWGISSIKKISKIYIKASMAVEAAAAVPVFLFFIMNVLFAFDILRLHGNLAAAMHQAGNKMAFYGYAYRSGLGAEGFLPEGMDSLVLSEGYAKKKVIDALGEDYLNNTCLASGTAGLHFIRSSVMKEDDRIELIASYKVKPFVRFIGFPDIPMENRYYGRAWTGYDVEKRGDGTDGVDPVVYLAEHGIVYHIARNCAYLNPTVEAVSAAAAESLRNESGEKYYACGSCKGSAFQAVVYVTSYGNRVHNSLSCSGLKRTIYAVHLSETEGMGKCTKCGK